MVDGARNALLGFLYQLLGTASVLVRELVASNDAWADLVARIGDGQVRCEEFGQDAIVRPLWLPDQGVVAIQFKYSASAGNVIERGELIKILFEFDRSRREAATGGVTIDRYFLITNRGLHANAQQLVSEGRTSFDPPAALRLPTTKAGKPPISENVNRLAPYGGNADAAARAWHAVLKAFDAPPSATFEGELDRLRKFAARYGVLEREWDTRLKALIGAFVQETAAGQIVNVTREWLKEHLVGDPRAANLQFGSDYPPHISSICRARLDERLAHQHRIPDSCYLPRQVQQEIRDCLALYPVVFVYGDGGCGKSLAVAGHLRLACDTQMVWSESATTATENSIVEAVNKIRLPERWSDGTDRSFGNIRARLHVANPAAHPVWTIDLDGVDEAPDRRAHLRDLINLCWANGIRENSPASLVVTCRSPVGPRASDQLIYDWFGTPESDLIGGVGFVVVGEFIEQELVQAAELRGGQPEERIVRAMNLEMTGSRADRFLDVRPIPDEITQALRHPVVWGGYASLEEHEREGVLDGDPACLARLAKWLLRRFLIRCRARKMWANEALLEEALAAAARLIAGPPPYSMDDWERGCCPLLSTTEAMRLHNEGSTYGLVRREGGSGWRWGHRFVIDYLAGQPKLRDA